MRSKTSGNVSQSFNNRLNNYDANGFSFYCRYVDDILSIFENESDVKRFFEYLNTRDKNIKFTMEGQENGKIAFLDVL